MKKNILILANPVSGTGKSLEAVKYIERKLNPEHWTIKIVISPKKGYFLDYFSERSLVDIDMIVAVGGDGTMHEILNGLVNYSEGIPPLLLFPAGSGNAFNYDLGCLDWDTAIASIERGQTRKIDIMNIKTSSNSLWAFNILGWGLVSDINQSSEKHRWLGTARYTITSLFHIFRNPKFKGKITADGEVFEGDFCFVLACNTQHTGKGMRMAPLANMSDGLIDLIIVKHVPFYKLLPLFPKIFEGKHLGSSLVIYKQVKTFTIENSSEVLNIDGEVKEYAPLKVKVINQKMEVMV